MTLEEIKQWREDHYLPFSRREKFNWLIAEVEKLTAEREEFKECYRLAMVSVNHAYDKGRNAGRIEALNAVFQINGPSRAITRLKEKYAAETAQ